MKYAVYAGDGRLLAVKKCPLEAEGELFDNDRAGSIEVLHEDVEPPAFRPDVAKRDALGKLEAEYAVCTASNACDKGMLLGPIRDEIARLRSELGLQ